MVQTNEIDLAAGGLPGQEYHDVLDALREQGPVVQVVFGGEPAWIITRHAELAQAFHEVDRFPPVAGYRRTTEPTVGRSFISMEEPEHRIYRKLATPMFRPIAVAQADREPLVQLAHELIDEFVEESEVDLVARFSKRFPMAVICRMLGIPRDAEADFLRWALGLLSFPFDPEGAARCAEEFTEYLVPLVQARRRAPKDDVISQLVAAEVEGRRLDDEAVLSHVRLLFPTGADTTTSAIGSLLYALLSQDGLWKRVVENRAERAPAIEELLRWECPVGMTPRVSAAKTIEYGGVEIPPDSWVLYCLAAANRDPRVYRDPHRFDPARPARTLLSFGPGPRQCPGMHLARKELGVALDVLCERLPGLRLLDAEASRPVGTVLRGPESLHVAAA
jgi:cytochrome P450